MLRVGECKQRLLTRFACWKIILNKECPKLKQKKLISEEDPCIIECAYMLIFRVFFRYNK